MGKVVVIKEKSESIPSIFLKSVVGVVCFVLLLTISPVLAMLSLGSAATFIALKKIVGRKRKREDTVPEDEDTEALKLNTKRSRAFHSVIRLKPVNLSKLHRLDMKVTLLVLDPKANYILVPRGLELTCIALMKVQTQQPLDRDTIAKICLSTDCEVEPSEVVTLDHVGNSKIPLTHYVLVVRSRKVTPVVTSNTVAELISRVSLAISTLTSTIMSRDPQAVIEVLPASRVIEEQLLMRW
ncbi:MAG: hypothetical protein DRJ40_07820 [Thermoprotei archaeon]|nr:MAG: hypothetical protein DRJ40_07820 [Thermoprotei archaeon]